MSYFGTKKSTDKKNLHYSIWNALHPACLMTIDLRDIKHPKDVLVMCWEQIRQDFIAQSIRQFRKRLASIIAVKGGHVEHLTF